jgi:hypothetical protein
VGRADEPGTDDKAADHLDHLRAQLYQVGGAGGPRFGQ